MPAQSDRPVESWRDTPFTKQRTLYKLRAQAIRTDDYPHAMPFVQLQKSIPNDTSHRASSRASATSIRFSKNPALVGDVVTVTADRGLSDVSAIKIGSVSVTTFTLVNDTSLTMTIPAAARTGPVQLTDSSGTVTSSTALRVAVLATAASIHFAPTTGAVGATITVTADKGMSTVTAITRGTPVVTITLISDTSLSFKIPVGATTGTVQFTNPAGSVTSVDTLTIGALEREQEPETKPGPPAGESELQPEPGPVEPAPEPEPEVEPESELESEETESEVESVPDELGSIAFSKHPVKVGDIVTVTAEKDLSAVARVMINDVDIPEVTFLSDVKLTLLIPSEARTGRLLFLSEDGTELDEALLKVSVLAAKASIHFDPVEGRVGDPVTVSADQGLSTVTAVSVHGVTVVEKEAISDTQLVFVIPPGATTGTVQLRNSAGRVTSADVLTVLE